MKKINLIFWAIFCIAALSACSGKQKSEGPLVIRAGHFPDIVHSQALVGKVKGTFQELLGPDVAIEWKLFNAGPSAIEALFADELDLTYIGPNPAINGYIKSKGESLRIVCGAASGGAGLVVREDSGINTPADFHGKKIATPQLGNTQDVACRNWLKKNGYVISEQGGDVQVIPLANPDQLTLFMKKEIDGAWTKEPWVARLMVEGGGRLFLDERDIWPEGKFVTAHVVVSTKFLKKHPDLVTKWIKAHVQLTDWINNNPADAKTMINGEIKKLTGKSLPEKILEDAFSRTLITYDPIQSSLFTSADWAYEAGFLGTEKPDLSSIYDLSYLKAVLNETNHAPIPGL
jgi:NitT/TauT family transport system substrate-binding protein